MKKLFFLSLAVSGAIAAWPLKAEESALRSGAAKACRAYHGELAGGMRFTIKKSSTKWLSLASANGQGSGMAWVNTIGAAPEIRALLTPEHHSAATISTQLETGRTDPLKGVYNISRDTGGTKSYGNFGVNSVRGGSAYQFQKEYGAKLGLTARPGSSKFDKQWKAADAEALHAAEMDWYDKTIAGGVGAKLEAAGVSAEVAGDPRVRAYFADRLVQYGPASIGNHARRIEAAFNATEGDAVKFLKAMSNADRRAMRSDFGRAIRTGVYGTRGHEARVSGRERLALSREVPRAEPRAKSTQQPVTVQDGGVTILIAQTGSAEGLQNASWVNPAR